MNKYESAMTRCLFPTPFFLLRFAFASFNLLIYCFYYDDVVGGGWGGTFKLLPEVGTVEKEQEQIVTLEIHCSFCW